MKECRYCGCTEDRACILSDGSLLDPGTPCAWLPGAAFVCTNPVCVAAHLGLLNEIPYHAPDSGLVRYFARAVGGHA